MSPALSFEDRFKYREVLDPHTFRWKPRSTMANRLLMARIAWHLHEHGTVEDENAMSTLVDELHQRGVTVQQAHLHEIIDDGIELGLFTKRMGYGGKRTTLIGLDPDHPPLPPNPWLIDVDPKPKPEPEPEPEPQPERSNVVDITTPSPTLPQWAALNREQQLLAIMDMAGSLLIDTMSKPVETVGPEVQAENDRLRAELETARKGRRDAEAAAQSHQAALLAERKAHQLVKANLDTIVAGLRNGEQHDDRRFREVDSMMRQRPVAR